MTRGRRINLVLRASVCLLRECTLLLLVLSTLSLWLLALILLWQQPLSLSLESQCRP